MDICCPKGHFFTFQHFQLSWKRRLYLVPFQPVRISNNDGIKIGVQFSISSSSTYFSAVLVRVFTSILRFYELFETVCFCAFLPIEVSKPLFPTLYRLFPGQYSLVSGPQCPDRLCAFCQISFHGSHFSAYRPISTIEFQKLSIFVLLEIALSAGFCSSFDILAQPFSASFSGFCDLSRRISWKDRSCRRMDIYFPMVQVCPF